MVGRMRNDRSVRRAQVGAQRRRVHSVVSAVVAVTMAAALYAFTPQQSSLDGAATAFAAAWRSKNADAVVQNVAPAGVRLTLGREAHQVMQARQALAAVAGFLGDHANGRVDQGAVKSLGGSPEQGSAEYRWQTVVSGTSEALSYTIFVSFVRSGNSWRITEIRVTSA